MHQAVRLQTDNVDSCVRAAIGASNLQEQERVTGMTRLARLCSKPKEPWLCLDFALLK
jgi:hypothetical protein